MINLPPFRDFKKQNFLAQSKVSQFIYQLGESEILKQKSKQVNPKTIKTEVVRDKINYLIDCLKKYRRITGLGKGIAAVQLGILKKIAVIYTPQKFIVIINPKITKISADKLLYPEICMSCYPIIAPVIRPSWIEFEYLDRDGKLNFWNKKDQNLNRVFQHEIDHMEGVLNIYKICSLEKLSMDSKPDFFKKAKFKKVYE